MHDDYVKLADELLKAIPEEKWDEPLRSLGGETPRQAADHVAAAGCLACRASLRDIAEAIVSDPVAQLALCAWLRKQIKQWEAVAKAELSMLPGERRAAAIDKKPLGFVTLAQGKRSTHVDEDAFTEWVEQRYPTEIVKAVRPAFRAKLLKQAVDRGAIVDGDGEICQAVMVSRGEPYPTTQLSDEADITVSALLSKGQLGVNGLKAISAADERAEELREAGYGAKA